MKVIEIISDKNIGGAGRLLLTRLSTERPQDMEIAVVLPKGSRLQERFEAIGIRVLRMDGCSDRSLDGRGIWSLCRIFRREKPDLINAHGCLSARIAGALCRVPVRLFTRHCAYPTSPWYRFSPLRYLCGIIQGALSQGVIAVADAAAENLMDMGVREERIRVIINGVEGFPAPTDEERAEARRRFAIPPDAFVVGICARLERCKGHGDFLRAAAILAKRDKRYRFLVAGEGGEHQALMTLARALGIEDRVYFTGFVEDIRQVFYAMDLNVNCSVGTETSSLALSEGMSVGLPAVVSDYGGNPYMIRHGRNGYVYPVGDFVQLARQISVIASDPVLYHEMSREAKIRHQEELNATAMTVATNSYYREMYQRLVLSN